MDVTSVLRDRLQEPDGLQRMVAISIAAHIGLFAILVIAPDSLIPSRQSENRTVMTITLGGTPGPANGGMSQMSGRPVQAEAPPEPPKRPEPVRPPAAKPPEMVAPTAKPAPVRRPPPPQVTEAPPEARGQTPTRGEEITPGTAVADTGARGQGFGLSTGGGGGSGSRLDVANFCCPDYLALMVERIRSQWEARAEVPGEVMVMFTIQRDGTLTNVQVERSSGFIVLDLSAHRAVINARQLPPLPGEFPNPTLTVHLNFQYTR